MKKHEISLSQLVDCFMELTSEEMKAFTVMVDAELNARREAVLRQRTKSAKPLKPAKLTLHAWTDIHTKTGDQVIKLALDGGAYDKRVGDYIRTQYKGYWYKGHHCWVVVKSEGLYKVLSDWSMKDKVLYDKRPEAAVFKAAETA